MLETQERDDTLKYKKVNSTSDATGKVFTGCYPVSLAWAVGG